MRCSFRASSLSCGANSLGGERDLSRLLRSLDPRLDPERYSFTATNEAVLQDGQFALIREAEGLTSIRSDPSGEWARISLGVHSSLEAIGLTAALSSRLADAGISANIVAALFHDHLFVPWERREEALEALRVAALSGDPTLCHAQRRSVRRCHECVGVGFLCSRSFAPE